MRAFAIFASSMLGCSFAVTHHPAHAASAEEVKAYPTRPVRLILASGPGSAPDVIGRLLGNKLTESWDRSIVIDNRPGATGLIAVELLVNAAPDGYTLVLRTAVV
jgi:tripartite-type tricarboxylate transporter receptor subunit TctC